MVVIGIDLAIRHSGVVVLNDKGEVLEHFTIKTKTGDSKRSVFKKYRDVMSELIEKYWEELEGVAIEGYSFGAIWNLKSITQSSEVIGIVEDLFLMAVKVKFYEVAPTQLKKYLTGKGNTKKALTSLHVAKRYNIEWDKASDELDALVLSHIALDKVQNKKDAVEYQQVTLDKIKEIN